MNTKLLRGVIGPIFSLNDYLNTVFDNVVGLRGSCKIILPWEKCDLKISHFTVVYGSEAQGDLVLIQTFLLYYVNQVILMLTSIFQEQFP